MSLQEYDIAGFDSRFCTGKLLPYLPIDVHIRISQNSQNPVKYLSEKVLVRISCQFRNIY